MPVFATLDLLPDFAPRDGAGQMAFDEILFETASRPVLRSYRWAGPWASFGYSQSYESVRRDCPDRELVRRWTGGGIVDHAKDWTFALTVPRDHPFTQLRPSESYCEIHRAVAAALTPLGVTSTLAPFGSSATPRACFAGEPAGHDVLDFTGQKLCGGAQRRTRQGILHQGSLQNVVVPDNFLVLLGTELASATTTISLSETVLAQARSLAAEKYASPAWTQRVP